MGNILKIGHNNGQYSRVKGYILSKGQDVQVALKVAILTTKGLYVLCCTYCHRPIFSGNKFKKVFFIQSGGRIGFYS